MSDKKYTNQESIGLLKRCLGYFLPYKWRIIFAFICMAIVSACTAAGAFLVKPALDDIFIGQKTWALYLLPPIFIGTVALKGLCRFLQNYLMRTSGLGVLETLRNELFEKMVCLPLRFFEDNQVGMLMSRIINDVMAIRMSMPAVIMIIRQFLTMIFLIGVAFYQDTYLAFWAVCVLPLAIYPFVYFGKKLRKIGRRNQSQLADISVFLNEIFSGIRVVKAFGNERRENKRFQHENRRLIKIYKHELIFSEMSSPVMELVGALGIGLVIFYGGWQVIEGKSTLGTFSSFLTSLLLLYDPIKKMDSSNKDIQKALAGAERVFEVLDSPAINVETGGKEILDGKIDTIEVKNLTFSYPGCATPALDGINLKVNAGETIALVGPSGSGKTTLVNLIPRFYQTEGGGILVNGKPVENYTLKSLRLGIGIVSQDPFLFDVSIKENIAYGRDVVDMQEVEAAARAAYAHDFISDLPEGYDTVVGERGVKLSGGQKQRLTIARALLKNPPLLILDEATSALDTQSERIVQQALENLMKNRTSIVIAHRLSTVLNADRIVVMEKGKIQAEGRHSELLETCPLYAKLYDMQFQDNSADDEQAVFCEQ